MSDFADDGWATITKKPRKKKVVEEPPVEEPVPVEEPPVPEPKEEPKPPAAAVEEPAPKAKGKKGKKQAPKDWEDAAEPGKAAEPDKPTEKAAEPKEKEAPKASPAGGGQGKLDGKMALEALKEDNGDKLKQAFEGVEGARAWVDKEGQFGGKGLLCTAYKLQNEENDTALHLACRNKKPNCVRACIEMGVDENCENKPGKRIPGRTAAQEDKGDLIAKAKTEIVEDAARHAALVEEEGCIPSCKKLKRRMKALLPAVEAMQAELQAKQDDLVWLQRLHDKQKAGGDKS